MNRREFLKKGKGLVGIIAGIPLISGCGKNVVGYEYSYYEGSVIAGGENNSAQGYNSFIGCGDSFG